MNKSRKGYVFAMKLLMCLSVGITAFCAKLLFMSNLESALVAVNNPSDKEEEAATWTMADFKGKRILLVEDIELKREIAEVILAEAGFVVETAPDGTDANAMEEDKEAALTNGMDAHLSKPVDIDALINVLGQFLE